MAFDVWPADDLFQVHAIRRLNANDDAAGQERARGAKFLRENAGQFLGVFHIVIVSVAGLGQGGHEVLVVIVAQADGADRDAVAAQFATETREVRGAARPDIGETVR